MGVYFGPQTEVTNGLILQLDAARKDSYPGSGNTWYDISGNGHYATSNSVNFNSSNGGSFVFNGNNWFTLINPITQLKTIQTDFTICAWINYNTVIYPYQQFNIFSQDGANYSNSIVKTLYIYKSTAPSYLVYSTLDSISDISIGVSASTVIPADQNKWTYVAVSVTGYPTLVCTFFVNDTFEISQMPRITGPKPNINNPIYIGYLPNINNSRISQILFYNRPLSIAELRQNYSARRGLYAV